jgi:hypothetical protein
MHLKLIPFGLKMIVKSGLEKTFMKSLHAQSLFQILFFYFIISWRGWIFGRPMNGTGGSQHHKVFIFDGKQNPKNVWFRGW